MRAIALLVLVALAAAQVPPPPSSASYSCVPTGDNNEEYKVVPGMASNAYTWGYYENTMNQTGWAKMYISSMPGIADQEVMFCAGVLEAYFTAESIYLNFLNVGTGYSDAELQYLSDNWMWTSDMAAANANTSDFWYHVQLVQTQFDGLVYGYGIYHDSVGVPSLSTQQLLALSAGGDLEDIGGILAANGGNEHRRLKPQQGHCSGLVKLADDLSEIYFGHTTWSEFCSMLRVYKWYNLTLSGAAAVGMGLSSYPGDLTSTDDFFTLSSNLVVMETTNGNYNASNYAGLTAQTGVLSWIRTLVANRLAWSAKEWTDIFAYYNSGTYNNQWIVLDYNLFTPGQPLPANTLWIVEQAPLDCYAADVTLVLSYGYWPSYNVAFFPQNNVDAGFPEMITNYGPYLFSYQGAARAEIFRRNQSNIDSMEDFQAMMRYNDWQNDPLAVGNAGLQISSRFDLVDIVYNNNPWLSKNAFGAVDSKVTSYALMQAGFSALAQSGPTHDQQVPFTWANWPQVPHYGHPTTFDFDWECMVFTK